MALVFISYSSKHRDLTQPLASAIEAQYGDGSVWWDRALESRAGFEPQIKRALEAARVVVVIWSTGATTSNFVYSEASDAARDGKLVNVRPADVPFSEIPKPFDIYHIDELGNTDRILTTIASAMRGLPIPTRVPLAEIYWRHHGKRVLDEKQIPLPIDLHSIGPSELLQARYAVVGYDDTTRMRARMLEWCLSETASAGRLIYGNGGLGKTRLMVEVAASLRQEHGWQAGFLDRPPEDDGIARQRWQALEQLMTHGDHRGVLIVMDYAEARQKELCQLAERLSQRGQDEGKAVRLVLLTRSAGDWWTMLIDENDALRRLFRSRPGEPAAMLMPTMAKGHERIESFHASVRALEPMMRAQGYLARADDLPVPRLARLATSDRYERPLAIQMEAMLWLASSTPGDDELGIETLLNRVLGLERAHWAKLLGPLDEDRSRDLRRGLAQVTVVQGVETAPATESLLMADRFYDDRKARVKVDPVLRSLAIVYGRSSGGIAPLEPDLIGEHHVASTADVELIDGCLAWIDGELEGVRAKRRKDLLTVLQRATKEQHGEAMVARACVLLDHIIHNHGAAMSEAIVAVMGDTPGELFSRLERQVETLTEGTLAAINFTLPIRHVSWMELSLRVAERYVELSRNTVSAASDIAKWEQDERNTLLVRVARGLGRLAVRLCNLGRWEEALVASQEGVGIYRTLARTNREDFLGELACSLVNTSVILSDLGQREEALTVCREALDMYRALTTDRPEIFVPELANCLNNFGQDLANLGRIEEALAASQEAIQIRRTLAKSRPDVFASDLAFSLTNLAGRLSDLGRTEDALAASHEAIVIQRDLAADRPGVFLPDLAISLNTAGVTLSNVGRHEEALTAYQEAVDIGRTLANDRPQAFLPALANRLGNLGGQLSKLGKREEALKVSQESVDIYRVLAKDRPKAFLPDLAFSLNNTEVALSEVGRHEEAFAMAQEALRICRVLAKERPDVFLPDLADSLTNVGGRLLDDGRFEEAAAASVEALEIHRLLAKDRPDGFLPYLARSLSNTGVTLWNLGRYDEALAASKEALEIRKTLARSAPDTFLPSLADSLNNFGNDLSYLGRHDEALAATQDAVEIRRTLTTDRPEAFLPGLADSLSNLGNRLSDLGRHEEAVAASLEALEIRKSLAEDRPSVFLPTLATSLNNHGRNLSNLSRFEDALAASRQAVEIRRTLVRERPGAFLSELAQSLNNLGLDLANLGRYDEALAASQEALDMRRALAKDKPVVFLPDLANSLGATSQILAITERQIDAAEAAREGLAVIIGFVETQPHAFGTLARSLSRIYVEACEKAARVPDDALLQRVAKALGEDTRTDQETTTPAPPVDAPSVSIDSTTDPKV